MTYRRARLLHVPTLICNPLLCEVQQSWLWSVATQECANTTFQSAVRVRAWVLHLFLPCKYEYCYSFPFWNARQYDMHKSKFHWLKHNVKCYCHSLMMIIDALQCAKEANGEMISLFICPHIYNIILVVLSSADCSW